MRLLSSLPTLLLASLIIFAAGRLTLVSPKLVALGYFAPEQAQQEFEARFRLDEPLIVQYVAWSSDVLRGDLGTSLITRTSVRSQMSRAIGVTLELAGGALLLSVVGGLTAGTLGGMARTRGLPHLVRTGAVLGMAVPGFWLGLVLVLFLSVAWNALPAGGYVSWDVSVLQWLAHMILPWVALAVAPMALVARVTQLRVHDAVEEPHVVTARGLGIRPWTIASRYVLRNALNEPVTVIGIQAGYLIGGALLIEQVFRLPGVGSVALEAVSAGDYPAVQATALFAVGAYLLINLCVDLGHAWLDVRVRTVGAEG